MSPPVNTRFSLTFFYPFFFFKNLQVPFLIYLVLFKCCVCYVCLGTTECLSLTSCSYMLHFVLYHYFTSAIINFVVRHFLYNTALFTIYNKLYKTHNVTLNASTCCMNNALCPHPFGTKS